MSQIDFHRAKSPALLARSRFCQAAESLRAVNLAPRAKRRSGPKVSAADVPTKYKPGNEDSKFEDNTGVCSTDRICAGCFRIQ